MKVVDSTNTSSEGISLQKEAAIVNNKTARWSEEKASEWYEQQPSVVGCNFVPSTAINQIEMWQEDTFDPETIDRELGWIQSPGAEIVNDSSKRAPREWYIKGASNILI